MQERGESIESTNRSLIRASRVAILALLPVLSLGMDSCQSGGRAPGEVGTNTCLACHDGRSASDQHEFLASPHQDISCESCHGPGLAHVQQGGRFGFFINNPGDYPFDQRHTSCAECHDDMNTPGGSTVQGFLATSHFAANGATCTDCHNVHRVGGMTVESESPRALTNTGYARLCGECHQDQVAQFARSGHDRNDVANCSSCHDMHAGGMFRARPENNRVCLQCHQSFALGFETDADVDFHTGDFHPVDPAGSGSSRCTGCHMPPTSTEADNQNHDHSLLTIAPIRSNEALANGAEAAPPNSCAGVTGCHDVNDPISGPPYDENDRENNRSLQALYEIIGAQP